ncbi:hypothetical protein [Sporosarcina sp. D27]|uniref:hypothetical protein n=1 Tax=Sporosarcina sp. D27 TaxID=1382305 RepID=UPI0004706703|nr:hypothetical protein [Sporosarcina sp. D27]
MNSHELFKMINQCVDELDFITARKYMEDNVDLVKTHKHHLQRNAQDLFEFVLNSDGRRLTQSEVKVIHAINDYAAHFNIRSFKLMVKDHAGLVSREDTLTYLNQDARALLESMHIITSTEET